MRRNISIGGGAPWAHPLATSLQYTHSVIFSPDEDEISYFEPSVHNTFFRHWFDLKITKGKTS